MSEPVRPSDPARWATVGGDVTEPISTKKDVGWLFDEKPPHDFFNWIHFTNYNFLVWVEAKLNLFVGFQPSNEKTIVAGVILPDRGETRIDTEGDAADDELDTITPTSFNSGRIIVIRAENGARSVIVKHATGNIRLQGDLDSALDDTEKRLTLQYDGANWIELSRSYLATEFNQLPGASGPESLDLVAGIFESTGISAFMIATPQGGTGTDDDFIGIEDTLWQDGRRVIVKFNMTGGHTWTIVHNDGGAGDDAFLLIHDEDLIIGPDQGIVAAADVWIEFMRLNSKWREISRSDNISQAKEL